MGQGEGCTTGCLLDYPYIKEIYKLIAIDVSNKQALDVDLKAMQQIDFAGNLRCAGNTTMFFVLEEIKETTLNFSQETVKVL